MSNNFYIRNGYTQKDVQAILEDTNRDLESLGALYEGTADYNNLTDRQAVALEYDRNGYDIAEQIHDAYSEIGALTEANEFFEAQTDG